MKSEREEDKPRSRWLRQCGVFALYLMRDTDEHKWVACCRGLFIKEMHSKILSEAQCQASALLQSILQEAIRDITGEE